MEKLIFAHTSSQDIHLVQSEVEAEVEMSLVAHPRLLPPSLGMLHTLVVPLEAKGLVCAIPDSSKANHVLLERRPTSSAACVLVVLTDLDRHRLDCFLA